MLRDRNELENTEDHNSGWGGIDSDHVRQIIPETSSLYGSILPRGSNVLTLSSMHNNACNFAHDIIT